MTDRDPLDPRALGALVARLGILEQADAPAEALEDATSDLFAALLRQGCLTPAEHEAAYLEEGGNGLVNVRVEGLGWLQVDANGNVEVMPE